MFIFHVQTGEFCGKPVIFRIFGINKVRIANSTFQQYEDDICLANRERAHRNAKLSKLDKTNVKAINLVHKIKQFFLYLKYTAQQLFRTTLILYFSVI